ncbi:hypothetical protein [Hymenobacter crusticola]|uniref:Uncharacterized protein n=1 Tax=Hymenobacter crusticola TaxID=1770526 RepID=A0A243W7S3_9BACT|nr:hypothetical protein [Hymenobacter crusticola]OUJ69799.1 hypothetical protein BXP70_26180 [Hymenobacter crusticola]
MLSFLALLLDELSPITAFIDLLKMVGIAALYWLTWRLLFRKGISADLRLLGIGLACVLAIIGFSTWPQKYSWQKHAFTDYILVLLLCIPLLAAAVRLAYRTAYNRRS